MTTYTVRLTAEQRDALEALAMRAAMAMGTTAEESMKWTGDFRPAG